MKTVSDIKSSGVYWIKLKDGWELVKISITRIKGGGENVKVYSALRFGESVPEILEEDLEIEGPVERN